MKPAAWFTLALVGLAVAAVLAFLQRPTPAATVEPMPTVAAKKPTRQAPARRATGKAAAAFPGLVRDPLTGLYVKPLAPGQKPVSRKVLAAALAESL